MLLYVWNAFTLQVAALTWSALSDASDEGPLLGPGVFRLLEHGRGFGERAWPRQMRSAAAASLLSQNARTRLVHWLRLWRRAGATPAWPDLLAEGGTNRGGL